MGKWIMDYVIIKMVPQKDLKWLNFQYWFTVIVVPDAKTISTVFV